MAQTINVALLVTLLCTLEIVCVVSVRMRRQATQGLTDEEKLEILKAHNHFRGMATPVATDMEMMVSCNNNAAMFT